MFDFSSIWSFIQANPILVLVVAYLFMSGKLTVASILSFFTGGKTADALLQELLDQLLKARADGDKDAEEAIFKTMAHCKNCTAKK